MLHFRNTGAIPQFESTCQEYAGKFASGIIGPHQSLSDQEGLNAPLSQAHCVGGGEYPALAHRDSR